MKNISKTKKARIKSMKKTIKQILYFSLALFVQMIFLKFCHFCFEFTQEYIVAPNGNIIEHFYMFLFAFIITLIIGKYKKIDFGYHLVGFKVALIYTLIIAGIWLPFSFIDAIFGIKQAINIDFLWMIFFQFFFSGLGEEIIFRSIPMKFFDAFANGKDIIVRIKEFNIDLSMIMSSLLFMIGHISFYSNQVWYAFIYSMMFAFFGGLMYSWIYRKTNSIWLCMLAHGVANVTIFVFPVISEIVFGT